MEESKVLEKLFPQLCSLLNTDEVKPYLVASGTLTLGQCEELQLGTNPSISTQSKLAEKTVLAISRHSQCATNLLKALEETQSAKIEQSGHYELVLALREEIDKALAVVVSISSNHSRSTVLQERDSEDVTLDGPYYRQPKQRKTDNASTAADTIPIDKGASNEPVQLMRYDDIPSKYSEKLRVKLVQESQEILEDFAAFTVTVGDHLVSKSVALDRVSTLLRFRLGSKNVDEYTHKMMRESNTIHSLLSAVEPFSSWFNYDLIALVARKLGDEEGERLVERYESQLQRYFHRLVFECPPFSSITTTPDDYEEMTVKVDWDYKECTVQDITIFKSKLCKFLKRDDPSLFILKTVDEGCVLLTWLFPSAITGDLISDIQICCSQLANEDVTFVRVGTKVISCNTQKTDMLQIGHPQVAAQVEIPGPEVSMQLSEPEHEAVVPALRKSDVSLRHLLQANPEEADDVLSPLISPSTDKSPPPLTHVKDSPFGKVQLREKKTLDLRSRLLATEHRKSSGYYSPVNSYYADSPYNSERSSWVAGDTNSRASSGYYSPIHSERTSLVGMAKEEEDYNVAEERQE